jgi:hypothetical protein
MPREPAGAAETIDAGNVCGVHPKAACASFRMLVCKQLALGGSLVPVAAVVNGEDPCLLPVAAHGFDNKPSVLLCSLEGISGICCTCLISIRPFGCWPLQVVL